MIKATSLFIIILAFAVAGCSVPSVTTKDNLYSFIREEKKVTGGLLGNKKSVSVRDFRENEAYDEDIAALKEEIEKYISHHPDLSEEARNSLRELKVRDGLTQEEVELLLGRPDKIMKRGVADSWGISQIWVYRISKLRAFTVFIFPVFFAHEGYYLNFKGNILAGIERHYLRQTIEQGSAPGVMIRKKGSNK